MKKHSHVNLGFLVGLFVFSSVLFPIRGSAEDLHMPGTVLAKITNETKELSHEPIPLDRHHPEIKATIDVQERHKHKLLSMGDIAGTAVSIDDSGKPVIVVFAKNEEAALTLPDRLEGKPVKVHVSGEIHAMRALRPSVNNKIKFPTPVPIGVSTGNVGECSAGTIGARVRDSAGNAYALSNNHVYAIENTALKGSDVVQPGLYDTKCLLNGNNIIGTLSDFVPINFSGVSNTVDAAIALSSPSLLGNATPSSGYGTPNSVTVTPTVGQGVQKYGRTTSLTYGTITGINATIKVNYGSMGTAIFVDQITVGSPKPFIKAGDSGSLLVTNNPAANPVGLLFAGNSTGTFAVANPIDDVLSSFGVTIDGK